MRKHVLEKVLFDDTIAATTEIEQTHCGQLDRVTYYVAITSAAALVGEIVIQWKNEKTNWEDLPMNTIALTADEEIYIDIETNFKEVRPKVIITAGSADFYIEVSGKTVGA